MGGLQVRVHPEIDSGWKQVKRSGNQKNSRIDGFHIAAVHHHSGEPMQYCPVRNLREATGAVFSAFWRSLACFSIGS